MDYKTLLRDMKANPGNYLLMPYIYTASVASLAAAATATDVTNIESDSPFVWIKTAYFADIAGAAQTNDSRVIPLVNVQIVDSGSARQFFDEVQPINSFAGQAGLAAFETVPYLFKPNSSINTTFTNFSAATTYANLRLSYIGYRVYEYSQSAV